MKILMFSTGMGLGGAETQIRDLAREMHQQGHELHVVWLTGRLEIKFPAGVRTYPLFIHKTLWGVVRAISNLRRLIQQIKPDVVHSHMVHANLIARMTRLFVRIPRLICTAHSSNEGGIALMWAYRLTDCLTDITTQVSEQSREVFLQKKVCPQGRLLTIHNGIDTKIFRPNPKARKQTRQLLGLSDNRLILSVGRLETPKNHAGLIEAFALVMQNISGKSTISPQASKPHLVIVGDGSQRQNLEALVDRLHIREDVTFLGARTDIPSLLNAADLFISASIFEGFGLAVAEAMATEKFVIATDCGVVPVILQGCGIVVPIGSTLALSSALLTALTLGPKQIFASCIKARQNVVNQFGLKCVASKWLNLYRQK